MARLIFSTGKGVRKNRDQIRISNLIWPTSKISSTSAEDKLIPFYRGISKRAGGSMILQLALTPAYLGREVIKSSPLFSQIT